MWTTKKKDFNKRKWSPKIWILTCWYRYNITTLYVELQSVLQNLIKHIQLVRPCIDQKWASIKMQSHFYFLEIMAHYRKKKPTKINTRNTQKLSLSLWLSFAGALPFCRSFYIGKVSCLLIQEYRCISHFHFLKSK